MAKQWIECTFNGVLYKVYLGAFDGLCSPPNQKDREAEINLSKGFKHDCYTLELLIHESLHSCLWELSEENVERTARDISKMLWKLYKPRKGII